MHTPKSFGRLAMSELLPAPAYDQYRALIDQFDLRKAASAVLPPQEGLDLLANVQSSWTELQRLEGALARGLAEEATVALQRKKYQGLRAEYDRRSALQEQTREALFPIARLLERIDAKIAEEVQAGRASFELYTGSPLKLKKGERNRDALERARAERQDHLGTLKQIQHAPRPVEESLAIVRAFVQAWAERGRLDVFNVVERIDAGPLADALYGVQTERSAPPVNVPAFSPSTLVVGQPDGSPAIIQGHLPDFGAMIAWLDPDRLLAKLEAEIRLMTDESVAISTEDRAAKMKDLMGLIIGAERLEEAAIRAAALEGDTIDRRADATPFVVLGLEIDDPRRHITIER